MANLWPGWSSPYSQRQVWLRAVKTGCCNSFHQLQYVQFLHILNPLPIHRFQKYSLSVCQSHFDLPQTTLPWPFGSTKKSPDQNKPIRIALYIVLKQQYVFYRFHRAPIFPKYKLQFQFLTILLKHQKYSFRFENHTNIV